MTAHCSSGESPVPKPGSNGMRFEYAQPSRTTVFLHSLNTVYDTDSAIVTAATRTSQQSIFLWNSIRFP
jgi:hypothetical protein